MIFSEYYSTIKANLAIRRNKEVYSRMLKKLPIVFSPDLKEKKVYNPIIRDVKLTKNGVMSYLVDEKYPLRFYTPHEVVDMVTVYKRLLALMLNKGLIGVLILYFGRKIWLEWSKHYFKYNPILLKEECWSQPVREIRRVLKDESLKDAISIILENDMAYCYRLQDILGELNKKNSFTKEIKRLADLYISRDHGSRLVRMAKRARKYLWLLRFTKVKSILMDINIDEIKLSKEDIYWTNIVPGYNYRGLTYKRRLREYNLEKTNSVANDVNSH